MGKLIKRGQSGMVVERTGPYDATIYLEKDPIEEAPASQFKIWTPGITPEERMDQTVKELTPIIDPFTNKLVRLSTYQPTQEQRQAGTGTEHLTSWVDYVAGLGPLLIPAVVSAPYWGPAAAVTLTSPAFWTNVATKTIPNLIKDTALYAAADAASEATTNRGLGTNINRLLDLEDNHPIGDFIGFGGTSMLRRPIEKAGIVAYKGVRGAIQPEYALSQAMDESLWKPYISRVVGENGKIRLRLPGHTDTTPREIVLDPQGNNKFYAHVRTWNDVDGKVPANLTPREIGYLYEALYNELPEGAEILFPQSGPGNYATRGTVAGLQRLARDPRFSKGSSGTLQYIDKDGSIKEFTGTSFIKTPTTPSRAITYKEPTYPLYYKNTFNFPGLEQYNYGVLPLRDTSIRPLQHLQGQQALQMFKEYGGIKIPDELPIKNELLQYAKEARVRYGLEGNTEITDQEIAEALYKHLVENDVVTYPGWGPLVGFRGTTSRANYLRSTIGPTEYATRATSGSMDNSLGKLFLGRLPFSNPVKGSLWNKGVDRYLYVARPISSDNPNFFDLRLEGAGKIDITPQFFVNIPERVPIEQVNKDLFNKYFQYSLGNFRDASGAYKVRPEYTEKGINDLNAYMFRTPAYRDITKEMSVADWNAVTYPENNFQWLTKEKPIINPDGISGTYKGQEVIFMDNGLESDPGLRRLVGDQYQAIHENAIKNNQGLYISRPSVFRQEHKYYPYIALPQWNLINAKHILPYDLRLPRLWGDPNVYLKAGGKLVKRINN